MTSGQKLHVVVVGSGAAGLAAAWLLARQHNVTLVEKDDRLGGHAHTAELSEPECSHVDTGFIVYNEHTYPNLTRWFEALGVATEVSNMSFSVSRDNGRFEYAGGPPLGLLAQPGLVMRPRYWRMLRDLVRFYRRAPLEITAGSTLSLGEYLRKGGYSDDFLNDHLLPFGAAIWSTSTRNMLDYPAWAFVRFCHNHGLLNLGARPQWRTVTGGSRQYVARVEETLRQAARTNHAADGTTGGPTDGTTGGVLTNFHTVRVERQAHGVVVHARDGRSVTADQAVLATHADQALALLARPDDLETHLLEPFTYDSNLAILHTDTRFMPDRRAAWCSWNYVERGSLGHDPDRVNVSYWMNRLQNLNSAENYIVTLNPAEPPAAERILRSHAYDHPIFNAATWRAQQGLWSLQGRRRTWFCGSYFGAGFHEDAVQAGFAVAEQLGALQRPWVLDDPSSRIVTDAGRERAPQATGSMMQARAGA